MLCIELRKGKLKIIQYCSGNYRVLINSVVLIAVNQLLQRSAKTETTEES
jgi:hypothetical protein